MSASIISFYAIGVIGLISALVVASSLNPIHRIAFLILVFLSGSFIMILLDFYFLGLTYIIVYVGAIMILFLFVIMMVQIHLMPVSTSISPRILDTDGSPSSRTSDLALVEGLGGDQADHLNMRRTPSGAGLLTRFLSFLILLIPLAVLYIFNSINTGDRITHTDATSGGYGGGNMIVNYFHPSWFVEFKTMTDLETLANILYLGYPTALLLIGIALWTVLIGIIKVTASKA